MISRKRSSLSRSAFAFGEQLTGFDQPGTELADFILFRRLGQQRMPQRQTLRVALHLMHPGDDALDSISTARMAPKIPQAAASRVDSNRRSRVAAAASVRSATARLHARA